MLNYLIKRIGNSIIVLWVVMTVTFLLMHSMGVNVSGQIASVIAGGLILTFFMH